MATFDTGISRYIRGVAEVENFFPVDHSGKPYVCCKHCRYFVSSRMKCGLNGELVNFPEKYLGANCPLFFPEGEN